MSEQTERHRTVAKVLIIAADPSIESLVGELVAFAGHRPVFDVTTGAAGESVRRVRPDVACVDAALDRSVVRACLEASREVGARVVLISSSVSSLELEERAAREGCLFFALPAGPRPLSQVLARALESESQRPISLFREARTAEHSGSIHPALRAALVSLARARLLALRTATAATETRFVREQRITLQAETLRSRAVLRAAVCDYAKHLKTTDVAVDEALSLIRGAISDCATVVGAQVASGTILEESESWARQVYGAA